MKSFSVAAATGTRGAGLGNEVIPWAKSYLAAEALGFQMLRPQWSLNRYALARAFGWRTTALGVQQLALRRLPQIRVTEELFRSTGEHDYGLAMRRLAESGELPGDRSIALVHEGMWGGYLAIAEARRFIKREMWGAPGVLRKMQEAFRNQTSDTVSIGIHVRRGDFAGNPPRAGEFNKAVPLGWYVGLQSTLREIFGHEARFLVCTDGKASDVAPLLSVESSILVRGSGASAPLQELAVLAEADLLISSVSSFSMLAAFLSERPYFWYGPQLNLIDDGAYALWAHEGDEQTPGSATMQALARLEQAQVEVYRGVPWTEGTDLPAWLPVWVQHRRALRTRELDLIYFGAAPKPFLGRGGP